MIKLYHMHSPAAERHAAEKVAMECRHAVRLIDVMILLLFCSSFTASLCSSHAHSQFVCDIASHVLLFVSPEEHVVSPSYDPAPASSSLV